MVEFRGISKRFGGTLALDRVDLEIGRGEIHGLLGQNGSGKSTLIKVLAGFHTSDDGTLHLNGRAVPLPLSPSDRREHGLAFVHQDLALIGSLTVTENLLVDEFATTSALKPLSLRAQRRRAKSILETYGVSLPLESEVQSLTRLGRAELALVRAVTHLRAQSGAGLLVLDEPTAYLPRVAVLRLFALVRQIASKGTSVLFVSHDMDEVLEVTERVTVLRDGRVVGSRETSRASVASLAEMIVGRSLAQSTRAEATPSEVASPVTLVASDVAGGAVQGVSFETEHGEILGFTGLLGSGFDEVIELLFGVRPARSGALEIAGKSVELSRLSPATAVEHGIAFIPADRLVDGSAPSLTVGENVALLNLDRCTAGGALTEGGIRAYTRPLLSNFDVRPPDPDLPYAALSGGNQQKALLAKWLSAKPRVLLIAEPTQGVDIGAREQIRLMLRDIAAEGCSVICASADLDQLAQMCTRVVVMKRGVVTAEVGGEALTKDRLSHVLYGSDSAPSDDASATTRGVST